MIGVNNKRVVKELPLLPIRDIVVYPFMILPLFVGRESSVKAVEESINNFDRLILLSCQKDLHSEMPGPDEIFNVGTVAMIMRMRNLPDGRIKILIQGIRKAKILNYKATNPFHFVEIQEIKDKEIAKDELANLEVKNILTEVKSKLEKLVQTSNQISPDILMILEDIEDPSRLADLIASNLNLNIKDSQIILETTDPLARLQYINDILTNEVDVIQSIQNHDQAKSKLKTNPFGGNEIHSELDEVDEFEELEKRIDEKNLPLHVKKEAVKNLNRFKKMHQESSESNIIRTYLDWILDIPWNETTEENLDLRKAKEILDEDHFDLEDVKERVLEHLAVRTLKKDVSKSPILCLSGPPGVGKTSLGKSIAKAIGRKFVRISLGGVKDESEIRGHRRTYVGAMPGKLIQAMKQAGSVNPLIMLDEIDKIGADQKGDPAAALLEVLDPEQNDSFKDHYLNMEYDLSKVLFIATANYLENLPGPLRDRMEIINLSGYSQEEKLEISKRYLIPKQIELNGIEKEDISFTDISILKLIKGYTREAGLRNLERTIGSVCRKVAKKKALDELKEPIELNPTIVEKMLGAPSFSQDELKKIHEIGIATGLAWTSVGGEILEIETSMMPGSGFTLTGKLGEVMKESAQTAFGFIRSNAKKFGIDDKIFREFEFHIHLPAGAIPKDGPSAGITLATALLSLITNSYVSKDIAMTGEITLSGKVLPVGGIKEKCLAAMRHGIETIIIPWKNQKDLEEIPEHYREKIHFVPVKNIFEVLNVAIIDWENQSSDLKTSDLRKSA